MVGEASRGDGEAAHVGPCVAVGDAQLEEARAAELAHQRAAFAVEIVGVAAVVRLSPRTSRSSSSASSR